jgi:hypothetical protein
MTDEAKREITRDETAAVFLYLLKLEAEGMASSRRMWPRSPTPK